MTSDYKKYSLEQLDNWVHDAIGCAEASPQEVYDTIKNAVEEEYYTYKAQTSKCYELLALLNGNGKGHLSGWNEWEEIYYPEESQVASSKKDKVTKWVLPVEETKIHETDETEYFVTFPDDLLEAANLNEGDQVEWVDNNDGSYTLKKVN